MHPLNGDKNMQKLNIEKFYVVEWSPSQSCVHVETIKEMLRDNVEVFKGRSMTDFLPIGIFQNEDDLERFLNRVNEQIK
jgi:hypothetical protein